MERLTIKATSGLIHLKDNSEKTVNTAIKKLSDYEDLEEQGKLLKLPCAEGDTVYAVEPDKEKLSTQLKITKYPFDIKMLKLIGNSIFVTPEEAEAVLQDAIKIVKK